jgi:hypothetical protein
MSAYEGGLLVAFGGRSVLSVIAFIAPFVLMQGLLNGPGSIAVAACAMANLMVGGWMATGPLMQLLSRNGMIGPELPAKD